MLAPLLVAASAVTACSVGRAFLDLPEPNARPTAAAAASAAPVQQVQEWTPAAIETVEDLDSILVLLPKDAAGYVDWAEAVRSGVVKPRWNRLEPVSPDGRFGYDFYIAGPNAMFDSAFPHSTHTEWLACQSCHPALYRYRSNPEITMAQINQGESCGTCHGPVAFPPADCERCHTSMVMPAGRAEPALPPDIALTRADSDDGVTQESPESFPAGVFAHSTHRIRYACAACHPNLFAMEAGTTRVTMSEMADGEACGACHRDQGEAFGMVQCNRCHYTLEESSGVGD